MKQYIPPEAVPFILIMVAFGVSMISGIVIGLFIEHRQAKKRMENMPRNAGMYRVSDFKNKGDN